nr:EAL domain-containing protein [Winslowiella arboricola]
MPVDVIKLDSGLIRDLSTNIARKVITRSVIRMLKNQDYVVEAEGVENAQTLSALKEYDCDQVQGYQYPPFGTNRAGELATLTASARAPSMIEPVRQNGFVAPASLPYSFANILLSSSA